MRAGPRHSAAVRPFALQSGELVFTPPIAKPILLRSSVGFLPAVPPSLARTDYKPLLESVSLGRYAKSVSESAVIPHFAYCKSAAAGVATISNPVSAIVVLNMVFPLCGAYRELQARQPAGRTTNRVGTR
jgi:hypothetical protein